MKLKIWEITLIIALVISLLGGSVLAGGQEELSDKLIRLHVVANSDSAEDQALKLQVRDAVLDELSEKLTGITERDEAAALIEAHLAEITDVSAGVVEAGGYDYKVGATLAVETFPTREYETFSLPAGNYLSLCVTIGSGGGRNWWCVVFPPICTTAAVDDSFEDANLTEDEISLITEDSAGFAVKFQAIEMLEKFLSLFR